MASVKSSIFGDSDYYNKPIIIEYKKARIEVRPMLSYPEMVAFVEFITDTCFNRNDGEYMPEMCDFAIRNALIEVYTNIDMPESDIERYEFLYGNEELLRKIIDVINKEQFRAITDSIDEKLRFLSTSHANEIITNLNKLFDSLSNFADMFEKQFEGVDNGDIKNMIKALSDFNLDENKFVETYMNANKQEEV